MDELIRSITILPPVINNIIKERSLPLYREEIMRRLETLEIEPLERESQQEASCSICMEEMVSMTPVIKLSCGHVFHAHCTYSLVFNDKNTCPLCREDIIDDIDDIKYYRPTEEIIYLLQLAHSIHHTPGDGGSTTQYERIA